MTKNNKKILLIVGIIIVLFLINKPIKKEGVETITYQLKQYFNNEFIEVSSDINNYGYLLTSFPISTTPKGQLEIGKMNQMLQSNGITYTIPTSLSDCSDLESEATIALNTIKGNVVSIANDMNLEWGLLTQANMGKLTTNVQTNLLNKLIINGYNTGSKRVIELVLPTEGDINNACDTFIIDFPSTESYSTVDKCTCFLDYKVDSSISSTDCVNQQGNWICLSEFEFIDYLRRMCDPSNPDSIRYLYNNLQDITIEAVCEGGMLFVTTSPTYRTNFLSYTNSGTPSFEYYRSYYMNNPGQAEGKISSTIKLDACYLDSNCLAGQTCVGYKCTSSGDGSGDGGGTSTTTTKEWYENPVIWVVFGFFIMFMLMMNQR